ncbi:neuropeptide FF receptor 1-like [Sinocyclocheilus grahami]|uniref:neuropeptide FF receptor 1-like n=1 Tax=Sinocyclocheilus grahami TaxID=75366 RepID=UPI0007AD3DDC|nr:PREDICTED: neuropeptide FF receptor 1-like [Sinocyclocheilus grahami]
MNLIPDQPPTLLYNLPRALDLQREPQNKSRSAPASFFNSTFFFQDNAALEWQLFLTIQEPGTIILTVLYSISFLVGFFGNVMSLKVLLGQHGSMRLSGASATRCLLINLAVCDLAVVCVCMPVTLGHRIYTPWVYGNFLCRAVPFTQAVSVSASVLSITVISISRYYAVHSPLQSRAYFTRRRILASVTIVWLVSSVICMPVAIVTRRDEVALIEGLAIVLPVCGEVWPQPRLRQAYNVLLFSALYCLPVGFNLTLAFLTCRRLRSTGSEGRFTELDPRSQALHETRLRGRRQIARMVAALVLLFALSWLPMYVTDIWLDRELRHPPDWLLQTRPFAQWLGLTNSSLNPFCYCFIGDLHRSAKALRLRLCGPSPASALALASLPKIFNLQNQDKSQAGAANNSTNSCGEDVGNLNLSMWWTQSRTCESVSLPYHLGMTEAITLDT